MFSFKVSAAGLAATVIIAVGATAALALRDPAAPVPATAHLVQVTASEYKFSVDTHGRIPAGLVELKLANDGVMPHEALLARLRDGVTLSEFTSALKSTGPAAFQLITYAGGAGAIAPNGTQVTWQALQGGSYVLLCMVSGPDGVPHLMKGMIASLTVTGRLAPAKLAELRPAGHIDGTVTAHDMTFSLPRQLSGHGLYRFTDTDLADIHEFGIVRLNKGVTAADVIAWASHPAGPPPFVSAGGFGAVLPGSGGWLRLNLAPGRYAAVCFVPDSAAPHLPHAAMGMVVPFTVTR